MELNINSSKEFTVEKMDSESEKIYQERLDFIKLVYKDNKNFKESVNLSKVWMNFKFNNCRYQPEVFYKLKKYLN
jgi:TATA-box binding protein (TBP) (component of TFIID and TFIIIB)|tara:strand:- start:463 stop:687 length:225 start_codon:yes stop_codon:yes gene_type:complete